ncbi:hypothetical protein CGMCC3_g7170 [Colletotrichum fructicola]|uniref:Uncharacterized protein n=1 Tax=Colletotrichum fructicola (strain Nara gc5) TaxID=1213859 RepID=A0A7J6JM97_COLFN|nr:uncharacterized protein CGMCC3_g7170 [Colletotrichum fructicola]KAE9576808.1 hypothetical protein CGMCC3_g7170 [Colletotrichum fructicola]KAF4491709.1 hypothetical protein CGGC5_v001481 [Colletotrichum fructicola Nara gc5]KAF5514438.1 hypothetical protein CGCF413_v001441 [Colletotrichum fructicola]
MWELVKPSVFLSGEFLELSAAREGHWQSETPTEARYSKVINHLKISGLSSSKLAYLRRALSACFEVSIGQR